MKWVLGGLAVIAVVFAACTASLMTGPEVAGQATEDPETEDPEPVATTVRGTARNSKGRPLAGGAVAVMREPTTGDAFLGDPLGRRIGPRCLARYHVPRNACDRFGATARLDRNGRFAIGLTESETTTRILDNPAEMWVTVAGKGGARRGPHMSFQFLAEPGRVKLPPLALWEPSTRVVRTDDGLVTLDVGALPQRLGGELPTIMYGARDGSIIWVAPPQESGGFFGFGSSESKAAPVDHRVLEDAGAWVVAEVEVTRDGRPLKGELVYRSAQRRLKGPGAPPSRHAGCSVLTPKVRRIRYDSCPFTDGDFDNAVDMQQAVKKAGCLKKRCKARKHADKARVMIDLGGQRDIELVVLRSDSLNYVIEASTDGTRWTRVGEATTSSGQAMVRPPSAVGGRYLRVRSHGMSHSFLREISVW